jgi:hypothetical protein
MLVSILILFVDIAGSNRVKFKGTVIDRYYKAESVRTLVSEDGDVAVESEEESFTLVIKSPRGKVITVKSSPELFYIKDVGDDLDCVSYIGWFTGIKWIEKVIE